MDLGDQGLLKLADRLGLATTIGRLNEIGVWEINPALPGVAAATALAITVILATKPPPEEITRLFDKVNSPDWVNPTGPPAP